MRGKRRLSSGEIATAAATSKKPNRRRGDRVDVAPIADKNGNPLERVILGDNDPEDEPQGPRGP